MADEQSQPENDETLLFSGEIPIRYYGNEDVVGIFADQVVVSHLAGIFTLYFYQMQLPPFLSESTEEKLRALEELKQAPSKCVARIVLTPMLMEQFYGAIKTNMDRFRRQAQQTAPKTEV